MRIALIEARLRERLPGLLVISALTGVQPKSFPAAYVFVVSEKSEPMRMLGSRVQRVAAQFAVELMVKHAGQAEAAAGGAAQDAIEDWRDRIKDALKGWEPTVSATPVEHVRGDLRGFDAGLATWRDIFGLSFDEI